MIAASAAADASPSPSKSLSRIQKKSRGKHLKLAMPSASGRSPIFTPESAHLTASEVGPKLIVMIFMMNDG